MEGFPHTHQVLNHDPNYENFVTAAQERRRYRTQRLQERIERQRNRLGVWMALAHGAVLLSLRSEPSPTVRRSVHSYLNRHYGFNIPRYSIS